MFKQIDYTMVIVSDMARSVEFYRDKLGILLNSNRLNGRSFSPELPPWLCTAAGSNRSDAAAELIKTPEPVLLVSTWTM